MGFWSKLGKIGLAAAPYVAAPFTGGASLALAPAANKALGAWNQKDANKKAAQGLAPSNFDKYLGMGADVAGMAGGMGAFNKLGNIGGSNTGGIPSGMLGQAGRTPPFVPQQGQKGGGMMENIMQGAGNIDWSGMFRNPGQLDQQTTGGIAPGNRTPVGAQPRNLGPMRGLGPIMGQRDQTNPNLAESIGAGRQTAMMDQPFRRGYETKFLGSDNETEFTTKMPPMSPYKQRRGGIGGSRRQPQMEEAY